MKNLPPVYAPIVRLLVLVVLLFNQALIVAGYEPFPATEEQIYEFFSTVVLGVATFYAFWKNNSFTKEAIEADEIMKEKKLERKRKEETK